MKSLSDRERFCFTGSITLLGVFLLTLTIAGWASGEYIVANLQPDPNVPGRLIDPNSYTIQQIIEAGGIIIGDKLFDAFNVTTVKSIGAIAPGAAEIAITPIQVLKPGAPFGGDYGMKFNSLWSAPGGKLADSTIEFRVTVLPEYAVQGYAIKDNALWLTAFGVSGTNPPGFVTVTENVWLQHPSQQPQEPLANKMVYYSTPTDKYLYDEMSFAPVTQIWITKDVGANGGVGVLGVAKLSEFYQTFSQVPEPSSLVLLSIAGLGLLGLVWWRSK